MVHTGSEKLHLRLLQQLIRILNPSVWFGAISLFSILCIYSTYVNTTIFSRCDNLRLVKKGFENRSYERWEAFQAFENDVLLMYDPVLGKNLNKTKLSEDCQNGKCSKVFVKGQLYENPNTTSDNCSMKCKCFTC